MAIVTKGQFSVASVKLRADSNLRSIAEAIERDGAGVGHDGGWGSIHDDPQLIKMLGVRDLDVGSVEVVGEREDVPERIRVRRYWWDVDRSALRIMGEDKPQEASMLNACDVVISASRDRSNEFVMLVSTRDLALVGQHVRDPLVAAMEAIGIGGVSVEIQSSPSGDFSEDFFFWLMYKFHEDGNLADGLSITYLRDVSGLDAVDRSTRLKDGVSLDRAELLAMIMGEATSFGPASFEFRDDQLGLNGAMKLYPDGSFSPVVGDSYYDASSGSGTRDERVRLVEDIAYRVLPGLRRAHMLDASWANHDREDYVDRARTAMSQILARIISETTSS